MKNIFLEGLGRVIYNERRSLGMSPTATSEVLGVGSSTLRTIESGARCIPHKRVGALCESLEFDLQRLAVILMLIDIVGIREPISSPTEFNERLSSLYKTADNALSVLLTEAAKYFNRRAYNEDIIDTFDQYEFVRHVRSYLKADSLMLNQKRYDVIKACPPDFSRLYQWWGRLIDNNVITEQHLHTAYKINTDIIYIVRANGVDIGFYMICPLSESGLSKALNRMKQGLSTPFTEHFDIISPSLNEAHGIWIGMVGGDTTHAAGYVLDAMSDQFTELFKGNLKCVMTKGSTPRGTAAMKRRGFQKIIANGKVLETSILSFDEDWLKHQGLKTVSTSKV